MSGDDPPKTIQVVINIAIHPMRWKLAFVAFQVAFWVVKHVHA